MQADWVLSFSDEVWWSRLALPSLRSWSAHRQPQRVHERRVPQADPDPKALACYGLLLACPAAPSSLPEQMWLRFVTGRPVSAITTQFLAWAAAKLAALGKRVWLLIWDNASWHRSRLVRAWVRTHNQQVKQSGQGIRILLCFLPVKSPWLNPIEPHWLHTRRRVLEPTRLLSASELEQRVCEVLASPREPRLALPE